MDIILKIPLIKGICYDYYDYLCKGINILVI